MSLENITSTIRSELAPHYSVDVVENFIQMFIGWKGNKGSAKLAVFNQELCQLRNKLKDNPHLTGLHLPIAQLEKTIAVSLACTIKSYIGYDEECFDLPDAIKSRQANCLGYSWLFYILGSSIGLSVKGVDVIELPTGELLKEIRHTASAVDLANGKTVMMDRVAESLVSEPFIVEKEFAKVGDYWELKGNDNPLGLYRRIRILDKKGLLAYVYAQRGENYNKLGENTKAISDCEMAIKQDPRCAPAYVNRGRAHRNLNQHIEGISDYTKAIELDPKCFVAYYNRGCAYWDLKQYANAISDFGKSIELDPNYAEAYLKRGLALLVESPKREHIQQAKEDLLKAAILDPGLKEHASKGLQLVEANSLFGRLLGF
jgi:tetratricopeptide (TPR) repeat protein